jgi:hypothetical protein
MVKPSVSTDESVASKFLEALGKDDDEEALHVFKDSSLNNVTGSPSPWTSSFIKSGEWDAKVKLQIKLMSSVSCPGQIRSTSSSPSGVEQFCGNDSCTSASHLKAQVSVLPDSYYIQAGPKSMSGFFATPKNPSSKLGGPVSGLYEARSKDPR